MGERRRLGPSWELQKLFCPEVGLSSNLFPFSCQSICCPARFPSPLFPPGFKAIEMFHLIPPPQNRLWFDGLWLDFPPLAALR